MLGSELTTEHLLALQGLVIQRRQKNVGSIQYNKDNIRRRSYYGITSSYDKSLIKDSRKAIENLVIYDRLLEEIETVLEKAHYGR